MGFLLPNLIPVQDAKPAICMNKEDMEFWIFPLDNPELYTFYSEQEKNVSLYYVLYIENVARDYSAEAKEVLCLRDNTVLLIDNYLVPVFHRLRLRGYLIVLTKTFCATAENVALLRLCFFYTRSGIIDMGQVNEYQKKCLDLIMKEYNSPYDDMQAPLIRNVLANMVLLSTRVNYEGQLRAGHLLTSALQIAEMIDIHAAAEKKKAFYANKLGITGRVLDKSLMIIYQTTFKKILINKLMIDAMRLLVFSDKTVSQIACELGYDPSNFNSLFLKWKGMLPKDLRINYRNIIYEIESAY
jgi:AraC-like DNA-binding protein